jgi:hypothetical protein
VTYETLRHIHIAFAALAALMLLVSAVIFIALDIPRAIGSVTGRAVKRGVYEIRERSARRDVKPARRAGAMTTALATDNILGAAERDSAPSGAESEFEVEYDITFIHTDEVIEVRRKVKKDKGE